MKKKTAFRPPFLISRSKESRLLEKSRYTESFSYQPAIIASVGHTDAQAPQSIHLSGSIQRASFFSLIALTGHSLSQAPQFTHASVTLYAILLSLFPSLLFAYRKNPDFTVVPQTTLRKKY
jgi:hypothetical protein